MLIDLACLALLALWTYFGWRRGFLLSALALVSLAAGYLFAYLLFHPVGALLGRLFSLQPLLAYPLGGMTCFALATLTLSLVGIVLRRRRRQAISRGGRLLLAGRIAGATLSSAYAAGFIVLLLAALSWLATSLPGSLPSLQDSRAARAAAPAFAAMARSVASGSKAPPALVGIAERLARDPAGASSSLGAIFADLRLRELAGRPGSRERAAAETKALRQLAADPDFLSRATAAGLLQPAEAGPISPEQAQAQLAARLTPLRRTLDLLASDREVGKLLQDPSLQDKLHRRDLLALANDAKFNRLAEKVLGYLKNSGQAAETTTSAVAPPSKPALAPPSESPPRRAGDNDHIFRWKDRRGRLHYGDTPPSGVPYEEIKLSR